MLRAMSNPRAALALLLVACGGSGGAAQTTAPLAATPPPAEPAAADPAARHAPDFTLTDTDGNPVTLSKLLADGPVILAFFTKAFTGG